MIARARTPHYRECQSPDRGDQDSFGCQECRVIDRAIRSAGNRVARLLVDKPHAGATEIYNVITRRT